MKRPYTTAILLCAGKGSRMGADVPKQYVPLFGKPVCMHTAQHLQDCAAVDGIVIVCPEGDVQKMHSLSGQYGITKLICVCEGGQTRQASVWQAIAHLPPQTEFVAIHDGARCLIGAKEIEAVITQAYACEAAVAACAVFDTVKVTDSERMILSTADRESLSAVQTPQVFSLSLYKRAMKQAEQAGALYTDDSALLEAVGVRVRCVYHGAENRKITQPSDLAYAEFCLSRQENGEKNGALDMRIGHGYDVHRLKGGRALIVGGVSIPFEKGLDGHSDADVLVHAIMDALLGAAGLPDIGTHFPDTDPSYQNADSLKLLSLVSQMLREKGYRIANIDSTIVAQAPKMAPYIPQMKQKIAAALGCSEIFVNVKATTEERLGFTGSGDGISAHAVCLLCGTA